MMLARPALLLTVCAVIGSLSPRQASAQDGPHAAPAAPAVAEGMLKADAPLSPTAERPAAPPAQETPRIPMRRFAETPRIDARVSAPMQVRDRRGVPLMIAGAALFVAGAVIGGDAGTIVMVTGAAIGAYGLYLYF